MTATLELPGPKDVRDVLLDLLGRDVTVKDGSPLSPEAGAPLAVAVYVDDQVKAAALLVLDLPLAAWIGASIGLVPKGGAEACIEDKVLSPVVSDNLGEVMNIVAGAFNRPGQPHVRLYATYMPGERMPGDIEEIARLIAPRLDLDIEIEGYGKGRLALVAA